MGRPPSLCREVTTLDRAKLVEKAGLLAPRELDGVERGLRAALDLR